MGSRRWRFIVLYLLVGVAAFFVFGREASIPPHIEPLETLPRVTKDWSVIAENTFSDNVLRVLAPTDYLSRVYNGKDGEIASLYIGYHDGSFGSGPVHSPRLCLPGTGWNEIASEPRTISLPSGNLPVIYSIFQKEKERLLILYWFRTAGSDTNNHYIFKMNELLFSLLYQRKDSAIVRVEVPISGDEVEAFEVATSFIAEFNPLIVGLLPEAPR
ncbi:MAG: EpsI family protein [Deltaproteobacteria bacterium]|nr:MAG: EpsI family protein [Deltaproteobacteria bacterium]